MWLALVILSSYLIVSAATSSEDRSYIKPEEARVRNKRDGSWSAWSAWSACSRTCGGGIRTQTRQCQIRNGDSKSFEISEGTRYVRNVSTRHCEGHSTRHHLCNTHECPLGSVEFRESQCKAFDNRPFMGKVYQWESFIDERSPCSLTCRAKGFRFFATLNKSVIDGTKCSKPNQIDLHVCISGACTPIGCDGIAGATRRLDHCGVCGGDHSTCRVVSGIFTRPQLTLGYNVVAHLPKSASNLNITEIRKSSNYLALRKLDGTFVLNGDWRQSWPGIYEGVGTMLQYTRNDLKNLESITSAGPLKEPLDLLVLYQQPNPGIKYEYILPLQGGEGISPIPPAPLQDPLQNINPTQARMLAAATSRPSSYVIGPPKQLQQQPSSSKSNLKSKSNNNPFNSVSSSSSYPVKSLMQPPPGDQSHHPHHHHHHGRRRSHGGIEKEGKRFYWKITGYTNCSEPCGGGTQRSIIRCVRGPAGNPVSDRRCTSEEKPPGQIIRCNLVPCPAEWIVGNWTSCSAECGQGSKTRSIHCQQRISPTLTMQVMEGACLKKKPETTADCVYKPCHHWQTSEWSECSARCGNGVRKRSLKCVGVLGQEISEKACEKLDKPRQISACNMSPCEGVSWFVSEWSSECSQKCGAGIQTRHVLCSVLDFPGNSSLSSSELESNVIDDDDNKTHPKKRDTGHSENNVFCDEGQKPEAERECFSDKGCGEAVWFTGEWGECSSYCGRGLKTRQVLCIIFSRGKFKVVTDSHCPSDSKPPEKQTCESPKSCPPRWFSSEWSECSAVCGGGTQKRSVSCRSSNWTLPSTLCSDKERPVERRSCNERKCSLSSSSLVKSIDNSNTDRNGMVKDKPLQQQAAGTSESPPRVDITSTPPPPPLSSSRSSISSTNNSLKSVNSSSSSRGSRSNHSEIHEEPHESECADEYRNCVLVVQARLCRYKYYRSVCCNSCADHS